VEAKDGSADDPGTGARRSRSSPRRAKRPAAPPDTTRQIPVGWLRSSSATRRPRGSGSGLRCRRAAPGDSAKVIQVGVREHAVAGDDSGRDSGHFNLDNDTHDTSYRSRKKAPALRSKISTVNCTASDYAAAPSLYFYPKRHTRVHTESRDFQARLPA
jgi:hypothetical protein